MTLRLLVAARTDVGRVRPGNEDAVIVDHEAGLVAVADGMGGHQAGEVASATAIDALRGGVQRGVPISDAIAGANDAVFTEAAVDPSRRGMGTTLTAAVLDGDTLVVGHVGDSRAYLLRKGELRQLTTDHSVVAELVAAGELTPEEAEVDPRRAMITRALGIDPEVEVDVLNVPLLVGDRLLLCSDGLTTMVHDDVVADLLASEPDRERAADALVAAANAAGGSDNITVAVADVVDVVDEAIGALAAGREAPGSATGVAGAVDTGVAPLDLPPAPAPAAPPDPPDPPDPLAGPVDTPGAATDADAAVPADPHPAARRRWWHRSR